MITKRQLGIGMLLAGVGVLVGLGLNDLIGTSEYAGIGTLQRNIMIGAGIIALVGVTLLPLGDRPA